MRRAEEDDKFNRERENTYERANFTQLNSYSYSQFCSAQLSSALSHSLTKPAAEQQTCLFLYAVFTFFEYFVIVSVCVCFVVFKIQIQQRNHNKKTFVDFSFRFVSFFVNELNFQGCGCKAARQLENY